MKKFKFLVVLLAVSALILGGCGENNGANNEDAGELADEQIDEVAELEYEPEDINPETDVCEICAMAVADDRHATQIVLTNHRSLKFDDLGCLYEWVEENGEDEIGAKFVRDFNTEEWVLLEDATFVFAEEIDTPMAYGMISFAELTDAESYVEENGFGDILVADDLEDHKWEMMDHDHHDHSHHDHGGGFHTEGFGMHVTELEDIIVSEETTLEVDITLDEIELEHADVRYEIWLENDKDNTDWIDAAENTAGTYVTDYVFEEVGSYHIQIHVENDEGLHEHFEYEVSVKE